MFVPTVRLVPSQRLNLSSFRAGSSYRAPYVFAHTEGVHREVEDMVVDSFYVVDMVRDKLGNFPIYTFLQARISTRYYVTSHGESENPWKHVRFEILGIYQCSRTTCGNLTLGRYIGLRSSKGEKAEGVIGRDFLGQNRLHL